MYLASKEILGIKRYTILHVIVLCLVTYYIEKVVKTSVGCHHWIVCHFVYSVQQTTAASELCRAYSIPQTT